MIQVFKLISNRFVQLGLVAGLAVFIGWRVHKTLYPPTHTTSVVHDTTTVEVEKPVLTERIVTKLITDPTQAKLVQSLLKENEELKTKTTALVSTIATLQQIGGVEQGGTIQVIQTGGVEPIREFKDFQLDATYGAGTFSYKLSQTFRTVGTIGRDQSGAPTANVRLFQDTPSGPKEIKAETKVVVANENAVRWLFDPRIQGGFGADQDKRRGGVLLLQTLKRGSSSSAEDTRLAIGSVGAFITNGKVEPILVPVSFNLGRIKHNPLTNIWVGPTIDLNKKVGISVSATF